MTTPVPGKRLLHFLLIALSFQGFTAIAQKTAPEQPDFLKAPTWVSDNGNGTFTNPLFYDEFSDPDMIRVEDDYYLTGTTMHTMPGLPASPIVPCSLTGKGFFALFRPLID